MDGSRTGLWVRASGIYRWYTARVAREIGGTHHRGVLPQGELVVRVAVRGRNNLLGLRRPLQCADLWID